ncbi:MAG: MBL fold metallo-hydrolase [Clostridia bacterium]|nr:MBL fold metallo-hydrolase [Clostridia bacterium]
MGSKERFYADIMAMNPGVTGSCNLVIVRLPNPDYPRIRFTVDCGLFQEKGDDNYNEDFPFDPDKLDFCLVTHNHVDHIGRLPLLVKKGFNNYIYTTESTRKLLPLSLWDCHKVLKDVAKRKHIKVIYKSEDVSNALSLVKGCEYGKEIQVHENVYVTFLKNGHLIGAALVFVRITYPGYDDINLLFTGDYKGENVFFNVEPVPERILELPLTIVQESTYGDMDSEEIHPCFKENILKCIEQGGTVIAPVFSLGRSQEILYELRLMQDSGELNPEIPIYFDGKLAIRYTHLYIASGGRGLDIKEEMKDFLPKNLTFVDKVTRGEVLNSNTCKIVLTTSGMGSYGPAQAYISQYIRRKGALIHFTGYTAEGTLGARLKEAPENSAVEVAGIVAKKLAKVEYTTEYSAHAKADEMIDFLNQFKNLKLVLVNHGEPEVKEQFADRIVDCVDTKDVGILGRRYFFRVNPYGLAKTLSTKFE